MLKQISHKNSELKLKKSIVGRMLIAVYVLVVLALSATAKADVTAPCLKFETKFSN
jgi:hypothetical protein